jgi:hypothetical protein
VQQVTTIGGFPVYQFTANGGSYTFNAPISITLPIPAGVSNPAGYYMDAKGVLELVVNYTNNGNGTIMQSKFGSVPTHDWLFTVYFA